MQELDRDSQEDARRIFKERIPNDKVREKVEEFLKEAIKYAQKIDRENWNLNLDLDWEFIRFNVGQDWCIEIDKKDDIVIVVVDNSIKLPSTINKYPTLKKELNALCCKLNIDSGNIQKHLENQSLIEANRIFIQNAITKTSQRNRNKMKQAHSPGGEEYLFGRIIRGRLGPSQSPIDYFKSEEPEKGDQDRSHPEGRKYEVRLSKYERKPKARKECLEHYGYTCQVCDANFEKTYGDIGKKFIHVHHITPLSKGERRETNPVKELIPVCPNCHAMLHRKGSSTWEQLKEIVEENRVSKSKN